MCSVCARLASTPGGVTFGAGRARSRGRGIRPHGGTRDEHRRQSRARRPSGDDQRGTRWRDPRREPSQRVPSGRAWTNPDDPTRPALEPRPSAQECQAGTGTTVAQLPDPRPETVTHTNRSHPVQHVAGPHIARPSLPHRLRAGAPWAEPRYGPGRPLTWALAGAGEGNRTPITSLGIAREGCRAVVSCAAPGR